MKAHSSRHTHKLICNLILCEPSLPLLDIRGAQTTTFLLKDSPIVAFNERNNLVLVPGHFCAILVQKLDYFWLFEEVRVLKMQK